MKLTLEQMAERDLRNALQFGKVLDMLERLTVPKTNVVQFPRDGERANNVPPSE